MYSLLVVISDMHSILVFISIELIFLIVLFFLVANLLNEISKTIKEERAKNEKTY